MKIDIEALSDRLVAAVFDGGYQGLIVVAVIWAALKLSPRANAATRYAAWMATLLVAAVLPVVQFFLPRGQTAAAPTAVKIEEPVFEESIATPIKEDSVWVGVAVENEPGPALEEPSAAPVSAPSAPVSFWRVSIPKYTSAVLVGGWTLLSMARLGGLGHQLYLLRGFRRRATLASAELAAQFLTLARRLQTDRATSLLVSSELDSPMAAGFLRPAILLPAGFVAGANARQMEQVLRHELAHVARRDDWGNLLQQTISAIFFFHPGIWVASRRLTVEREIACDDHALAAIGAPRDYALFLTEFAGRARCRDWTAAPAAWSNKSQLKERIVMILDGKRNASPRLARMRAAGMAAAAVALAAGALLAGPRLVLAGEPEPEVSIALTPPKVKVAIEAPAVAAVPATPHAPQLAVVGVAPQPAPVAPIAVPHIGDLPRPGKAPRAVVGLPGPDSTPEPPSIERRNRGQQDSIERRLEALERAIEKLTNKEKGDKPSPRPGWSGEDGEKFKKMSEDHAKMAEKMAKMQVKEDEWSRMKEEVQRQTEHAKREAERAARDAERAAERASQNAARMADGRRQGDQGWEQSQSKQQSLKARRSALEAQRRSIEKQLEALEKEEQKDREKPSPEKEKKKDKDNSDNPKPN